MKRCTKTMLLVKCKLKQQWAHIIYTYYNGQNPEHQLHQVLVIWNNKNLPSLLVGLQNGYSHFRRVIWLFFKNWTHPCHTIQKSCYLVFTQMSRKFLSTPKPTHRCLQQLCSHLPTLGSNQMSCNRWMDKQTVVHSDNYLVLKIKEISSHKKIWRKLKCMLRSERSHLKMLHTVMPCIPIWKRQN